MKLIKQSAAIMALVGATLISPAALAEKVGYVNIDAIFRSLPQTAQIEVTLKEEFKDQVQEVQTLEKDLKYYMEKQQRDVATMSEQEKKDLEAKLKELGAEYQKKAAPLKQNLEKRNQEEQAKIVALIKQAIETYAEKENYDVIQNTATLVYLKNQDQEISKQIVDIVSKTN